LRALTRNKIDISSNSNSRPTTYIPIYAASY